MGRMRSWMPWILVGMLGVAAIVSASVGAATEPSQSTQVGISVADRGDFCQEMRSVVLVGQRLPELLEKMKSESMRTAKTSLLENLSVAERNFRILRDAQGVPSNIKSAFDQWAVAVDRSETALRQADTKGAIQEAAVRFTGAYASVAVLAAYAFRQCKGG
jgi:hypothetical protein